MKWNWCGTCRCAYITCSKCGNNCCNAGTSTLPNGEQCGCKEAYEYQKTHTPPSRESFPDADEIENTTNSFWNAEYEPIFLAPDRK